MRGLEQIAGQRLLFLNWRDQANPEAGGAEAYTEEIAARLAAAGAEVTLFTGKYPGAAPFDWAREYLVAREGGKFGVYPAAARYLRKHGRYYDAVVDFQNGIPFFSPLFAPAGTVVVCVVHHVHQSQFDMYFRWPMNHVGRLLEGRATARLYRHTPFVAVSPSTRAEMRRQLGITAPIHIVPNGVRAMPPSTVQRSETPEIAVVTRLVPHKRLHLLVEALPSLLRRWPDLHVYIAGDGPARAELQAESGRLGLEQHVSLPGRVPDQVKADLLSRAWLTVAPSLAEGWGLTIMEANSVGTPAVAYDVPGLRDSVRDGLTGWLFPADRDLAIPLASALAELSDAGPARSDSGGIQALGQQVQLGRHRGADGWGAGVGNRPGPVAHRLPAPVQRPVHRRMVAARGCRCGGRAGAARAPGHRRAAARRGRHQGAVHRLRRDDRRQGAGAGAGAPGQAVPGLHRPGAVRQR